MTRGRKEIVPKIISPQWTDVDENLLRSDLGEDRDEIIIGDPLAKEKFIPQVQLTRWNKEDSLYLLMEGFEDAAPVLTNEKVEAVSSNDATQGFYFDVSTGALKFGLILYAKPKVNSWSMKLQGWENFNFYYQPPLANLNPDGSTWEIGPQGEIRVRPAEINGAYAVYHKTKANHILGRTNYKTGQFGMFERIRFVDALGFWTWADLNIEHGIYTVTCPQAFLDKATYPVRANDTFGYTSIGGSYATMETSYTPGATPNATYLSPSTGGTITKYSFYGRTVSGAGTMQMTAFSFSGGVPVSRLAAGSSISLTTTAGWRDSSVVSQEMADGIVYCVAFGVFSAQSRKYYNDGSAGSTSVQDSGTTFPATWEEGFTDASLTSAYATYTPPGFNKSVSGSGSFAGATSRKFMAKRSVSGEV